MKTMKKDIRNNAESIKNIIEDVKTIEEELQSMSDLVHKTLLTFKNAYRSNQIPGADTSPNGHPVECQLSEDLKVNIDKIISCADGGESDTTGIPSVDYRHMLNKIQLLLKNVVKDQSMISGRISALNQQESESVKSAAGCFTIVKVIYLLPIFYKLLFEFR
jgi:hypothetical protein